MVQAWEGVKLQVNVLMLLSCADSEAWEDESESKDLLTRLLKQTANNVIKIFVDDPNFLKAVPEEYFGFAGNLWFYVHDIVDDREKIREDCCQYLWIKTLS